MSAGRRREAGALVVWIAALAATIAGLVALGSDPSFATPPVHGLASWVGTHGAATALFALLRLVALLAGGYLLAVTLVALVLRLGRADRLASVVERCSPPTVGRIVRAAVGLSVAASSLTAASAGAAEGPPATTTTRPTVTMHRLDESTTTTLTTVTMTTGRPAASSAPPSTQAPPTEPDPVASAPAAKSRAPAPEATTANDAPEPLAERSGPLPTSEPTAPVLRSASSSAGDPPRVVMRRLAEPPTSDVVAPDLGGASTGSPAADAVPTIVMRRLAERPTIEPAAPAPASDEWEVVRPGDHFWAIAERRLADAWQRTPSDREVDPFWRALVESNRPALHDPGNPDLLFPGDRVRIPAAPPRPGGGS